MFDVASRANIPMVKHILIKVYSPVVPSCGLQLTCDGLCANYLLFNNTTIDSIRMQTNRHSDFKGKDGQPKGINVQFMRTPGLPKVGNYYGSRATILPVCPLTGHNITRGNTLGRGRVAAGVFHNKFNYCTNNAMTDEVKVVKRLRELHLKCVNNPNEIITNNLHKLISDRDILSIAYEKKSKPGNMTPGITPDTLDGMSSEVLGQISDSLKSESFQFSPARRIRIPKKSGGERPLTIAPAKDKLVLEGMRMILEAIFEPTFLDCSHGFRPLRSCHTALKAVKYQFVPCV